MHIYICVYIQYMSVYICNIYIYILRVGTTGIELVCIPALHKTLDLTHRLQYSSLLWFTFRIL